MNLIKIFTALSLLLFGSKALAQPALKFADTFGTMGLSTVHGLSTNAWGTSCITGEFYGTLDMDPSAATATIASAGQKDIFIAKYDSSGIYQWAFSIGGALNQAGYAVCQDTAGNIFITGLFEGTVDFDPSANTASLSSNGAGDLFVAKYASNGAYQWVFAVGGTANDNGLGISTDIQGNCFVTGYYQDTVDFDPSMAVYTLPSNGQDAFVAKYTSGGLFQWALHLTGASGDISNSVKCDATGNCYITGSFAGTAGFDPAPSTILLTAPGNYSNTFVAKYGAGGNCLWAFSLEGAAYNMGNSLALDTTGNIFITGFIQGYGTVVDFDPSPATSTLISNSSSSAYIAKYSNSGTYQWAFLIGNGAVNAGLAISTDLPGNCCVTGYFSLMADFDPSPATAYLNAPNWGAEYVFAAKYNGNGSYQWAFHLNNTTTYAYGQGIATDALGNTYLAGPQGYSTTDYDPTPATYTISLADIFLAKYTSCGAPAAPVTLTNTLGQTVCAGSSVSLSALGSGTIAWFASPVSSFAIASGTSITLPALSAGVYTYYAAATTCTSSIGRAAVIVTVNPLPPVNITNPTPSVCAGQAVILTATGALTYTWVNLMAGSSIMVNPLVTTIYSVTGTDTNNCTNSALSALVVDLCTALKTETEFNTFLLFPVPAQDELQILVTAEGLDNGFTKAEIVNSLGQLVKEQELNFTERKAVINIKDLPNGAYLLSLKSKSAGCIHKRFIISH